MSDYIEHSCPMCGSLLCRNEDNFNMYYSRRARPDGPGDPFPTQCEPKWELSDLQDECVDASPPKASVNNRRDPLAGATAMEIVLRCVHELNPDELEAWAEQGAGILRGRVLYGPLDALHNGKDWPSEASEEQRDLATYQAFEIVKRRRHKLAYKVKP